MRILLVEDNRKLSEWLSRLLADRTYTVDQAFDGEEADAATLLHPYALIILDLGLPGMSGLEFLKQLRARRDLTPVLILTASDKLSDRVAGLDSGADDYLAKPFETEELEARIRAHLRRAHGQATATISVGTLTFDTNTRVFTLSGAPLGLTPRERSVLEVLINRVGSVVPKEALAAAIFGFNEDADPNAIEIYVHRIRKKVLGSGIEISTLRGLGYMLRGSDDGSH
ncbi:response regulator [Microvirga puerhi]|uniref:Response regulator n=1 Tax=Microvirga puerhi TaxID=2876078 RepID=A0ABS7VVX2_9HYPH|nr:response regulator [Microvirga puerhi]MBZ6079062.1 response regulator [Microvirga puerhi]